MLTSGTRIYANTGLETGSASVLLGQLQSLLARCASLAQIPLM
jgi:hypothetical protein